jgi:hypothetical protein
MTHDEYRDLLYVAASGDMDQDARSVLERHLAVCEQCRKEYGELQSLHRTLLKHGPGIEADDHLLAEARQELRVALRQEASRRSAWFGWFGAGLFPPPVQIALGGAFVLAVGLMLGRTVFPSASVQEPSAAAPLAVAGGVRPVEEETKITNVHFVGRGSESGEIEFTFDAVTPVRMRGSIDDPKVQKVLTHAMLNEENPGVRLQAVNALGMEGLQSQDVETKAALIKAMEADANAGVRKEAMNALRRLPFDTDIKKALLHTLMTDANPGLRVAAINALDSARTSAAGVDSEILAVLKHKAETDDNNYIRVKARAVILEATNQ